MLQKLVRFAIAPVIILLLIGGTCAPPGTYYRAGVCERPSGGAPAVEEVASLVRITNRPSHDCTPDLSPDGKHLAFESWEPNNFYDVPSRNYFAGDFDIWMVGAHGGGGYQRITNNSTDDYYPAWYPDGKRLLFTSERSGYPSIWAKSANGVSGTQKLSWMGTCDFSGDVGPHGKNIVFSSADTLYPTIADVYWHFSYSPMVPQAPRSNPYYYSDPSWHPRWHPRIYRMDPNGARLTDLGSGFDPNISPDGKRIVYSSFVGGTWDVWVMDINGQNKIQITTYPGNEIDPCWSPDGRWIAYSKSAPGSEAGRGLIEDEYWNIWVTNIETGENIQKTFSRYFRDLSPSWGYVDEGDHYRDYIFFHSDRDDFEHTGYDIYRLDPDMGIEQYDVPDKPKGHSVKKETKPEKKMNYPKVQVLNSTSISGWATKVGYELEKEGLNVVNVANTQHEKYLPHSKIYYYPEYKDFAIKLAYMMPGDQYVYSAKWDMGEADITVVLGGPM